MTREDVVKNLLSTYGKYGVTKELIESDIDDGLKHGFSFETIYTGLRLAMGKCFNEREHFTTQEIAEALGMTHEEVIQEIENMREQAIENGENPDDYAVEIDRAKTQRFIVYPGGKN